MHDVLISLTVQLSTIKTNCPQVYKFRNVFKHVSLVIRDNPKASAVKSRRILFIFRVSLIHSLSYLLLK